MNHDIEVDYSDETALAEAMKRFRVVAFEDTESKVEKFTPNHRVWNVSLYMDGELIYCTNFQSAFLPEGGDVWSCIAQDAMSYKHNSDLADFLDEFGYVGDGKSVRRGINAYEGCMRTYETLRAKCINPDDLADLFNEAENADVLDSVQIDIKE